jgi:hypothetical protein
VDIIAHGISTAAAVYGTRRWTVRPVNMAAAVCFGVCPDLVSFAIPACLRVWWWATGASPTLLPTANGPHFEWVWDVYNASHSLLVFGGVFAGLLLVLRRPVLEMFGWVLHIALDTFTHTGIFATQMLWPATSVHIDGIPWETPWLLAATYTTLAIVWMLLWRRRGGEQRSARSSPSSPDSHAKTRPRPQQ